MRMILVFVVFAAVAGLASLLLWHLAPGLGVDMMLIYLGLAALAAVIMLITLIPRRGSSRDG